VTAGFLIVVATFLFLVAAGEPPRNAGPPGSPAYRFIMAFASVIEANHPRVRIKLVQVADLAASANAIEDHATDLGIVRSDAVPHQRRDHRHFAPGCRRFRRAGQIPDRQNPFPRRQDHRHPSRALANLQRADPRFDLELLQYFGEGGETGVSAARRNRSSIEPAVRVGADPAPLFRGGKFSGPA
jgi:hypothetical protein